MFAVIGRFCYKKYKNNNIEYVKNIFDYVENLYVKDKMLDLSITTGFIEAFVNRFENIDDAFSIANTMPPNLKKYALEYLNGIWNEN